MKYKAIIVEDEIKNRNFLESLVAEFCPELFIGGMAATVADAVRIIEQEQPDIVFMDIELQPGTGFDVLKELRQHNFQLIFITAYDHYAIKAIKFSAIDYILKPVDIEELQAAAQKAVEAIRRRQESSIGLLMQNLNRMKENNFSISLSTSDGVEYVPLETIIRLEASGPYTTFFIKGRDKIMVSKNLKEYELLLTDHGFLRVHNSHMINLKEVRKMIKTDGGYAVMSDASMIAISPKKKEEFLLQMSQRLV